MQQLHLVGVTADHDGLIFSARRDAKSGAFTVELDERLLDVIEDSLRRQAERGDVDEEAVRTIASRGGRSPSQLNPREIQSRLRAGYSISDVAEEAGVDEGWVARFAAPILAEQEQVVARALPLLFVKPRLGESAQPLGVAVRWNLADRGLLLRSDEFRSSWSAYQLAESAWVVRFVFINRRREQVAEWVVDIRSGDLIARNRLASDLAYVEPGRRRGPGRLEPSMEAHGGDEEESPTTPHSRGGRAKPGRRSTSESATSATRKTAAKKSATKKSAIKKKPSKKNAAKKNAAKKPAATRTAARKPVARRGGANSAPKRASLNKAPAKKPATKKAAPKKAAVKKPVKKAPAKKAAVKKPAVKRTATKRPAVKRAATKKPAAKKAAAKKRPAASASASRRSLSRPALTRAALTRPRPPASPGMASSGGADRFNPVPVRPRTDGLSRPSTPRPPERRAPDPRPPRSPSSPSLGSARVTPRPDPARLDRERRREQADIERAAAARAARRERRERAMAGANSGDGPAPMSDRRVPVVSSGLDVGPTVRALDPEAAAHRNVAPIEARTPPAPEIDDRTVRVSSNVRPRRSLTDQRRAASRQPVAEADGAGVRISAERAAPVRHDPAADRQGRSRLLRRRR
ncbi:MAG TPA: septation protein SepH [Acidimicrobiales bacterium]|nr:septation protein SepH [Acidimicrobiales bacterium]